MALGSIVILDDKRSLKAFVHVGDRSMAIRSEAVNACKLGWFPRLNQPALLSKTAGIHSG
jgi:hypothetical protein